MDEAEKAENDVRDKQRLCDSLKSVEDERKIVEDLVLEKILALKVEKLRSIEKVEALVENLRRLNEADEQKIMQETEAIAKKREEQANFEK